MSSGRDQPRAGGAASSASSTAESSVGSASTPSTVTPERLPSSASLASRSACEFCARGTHV